jgi:hypothetical protein
VNTIESTLGVEAYLETAVVSPISNSRLTRVYHCGAADVSATWRVVDSRSDYLESVRRVDQTRWGIW